MYTMKCIDFHACITANSEEMDDPQFDFCFDAKTIDDYFTSEYDLEFNEQMQNELDNNSMRLSNSEKKIYFDLKRPNEKYKLTTLSTLDFFDLFYCEVRYIEECKSKNSIAGHLKDLKLAFFDRIYLYSKLIEYLNRDQNSENKYVRDTIYKEYLSIYDRVLSMLKNDVIKKKLDDWIYLYNELLSLNIGVKAKLQQLIEMKHQKEPFDADPVVNHRFITEWLNVKLLYYQDLNHNSIEDDQVELSDEVKELKEIIGTVSQNNTNRPKKSFPEYLQIENSDFFAAQLREEFKIERSKGIRLMIEVLVRENVLMIGHRQNKEVHLSIRKYFERDIGTYESVFSCNLSLADEPEMKTTKARIVNILQNIESKSKTS